jgi:hypothetical protein
MLRDGANFILVAALLLGSFAAAVYALYCAMRATGKNLRLLGQVKKPWMVPFFLLIPYSGFLTDEGRAHRAGARSYMWRSAIAIALSPVLLLFWALMQPRPPAWCADATPEKPKVGCPTTDK